MPHRPRVLVVIAAVLTVVSASLASPVTSTAAPPSGRISGRITDAVSGEGLAHATVHILDGEGMDRIAHTAGDGTYLTPTLGTNASGYHVCVEGDNATGGSSLGNYQDQCYHGVPWSGDSADIPVKAAYVPVPDGGVTAGVDVRLKPGGAVTGQVVAASDGVALVGAAVRVYSKYGAFRNASVTGPQGHFRVGGLRTDDYVICIDPTGATGGDAPFGRQRTCNGDVPWPGPSTPPYRSTVTAVSAGTVVPGAVIRIPASGAISGTVTARRGVHIVSIDPEGFQIVGPLGYYSPEPGSVTVTGTSYVIAGLPPSTTGYSVCLGGYSVTGRTGSPGFLSQCWDHVTTTEVGVPIDATPVPVTAAQESTGIDFALDEVTSVAGTVTSAASGAAVPSVSVVAYRPNGDFVASQETSSDGTYHFIGLAPSAAGYVVCFIGNYETADDAPYGFQDECYQNVPWDLGDLPSGTQAVPVARGAPVAGIDAQLEPAGAIAGVVKDTSGVPLGSTSVSVFSGSGVEVDHEHANGNGTWRISGLNPGSYTVCFDGSRTSVDSPGQFAPSCFKDVPWNTDPADVPAGTRPVTVAAGTVHAGITGRLGAAGGIKGKVTAASDGTRRLDAEVQVFTPAGLLVRRAVAYGGQYEIDGLPATSDGYVVCFDDFHYLGRCYDDVAWDGTTVPADASHVVLTAGAVQDGIDAALVHR